MATPPAENFDALHERVLRFIGAFSSTQFAIDTVISFYLHRRIPDLGPELDRQFLRRIRDDQRLPLFTAFAAQANYEGDLTNFARIYNRAKQLRDMIGHSLSVIGPVYSPGKPPGRFSGARIDGQGRPRPRTALPSTFIRLIADCEWLTQHVYRAGYTAEPQMFKDLQGNPSEPPVPELLPQDGEPL
jgi:hypothetical protein